MVREAIRTARAAGATGAILVRGDSAYGSAAVIGTVLREGAQFSVVLPKNPAVVRAIASIDEHAWTPVRYPGAVTDPDTGELISDAEVAEVPHTAFAGSKHAVTARLIVRRVRDRAKTDELFPVWRHHPFFTNSIEATREADITHRRHAIVESVFADLIDGPLAHPALRVVLSELGVGDLRADQPQPLRAAGTLTSPAHAVARGATLRGQLINVPARLARPQRKATLHLPEHWPWANSWNRLWQQVFTAGIAPPAPA